MRRTRDQEDRMETCFSETMHGPALRRRAGPRRGRLPSAVAGGFPHPRESRSVLETRAGPCSPRGWGSFPRAQDRAPRSETPGTCWRRAARRGTPQTHHRENNAGKNLGLAPAQCSDGCPKLPPRRGGRVPRQRAPRPGGRNCPRLRRTLFFPYIYLYLRETGEKREDL